MEAKIRMKKSEHFINEELFRSFYYDLQTNSVIFALVVIPRSDSNSFEFLF
tara:strand:- start:1433 stop:1585 length:153 start_codon:yes stop_codon:yes gene_type:complete